MNRPIIRLYAFVAVLFALLVVFTSRWTVFEASSLRDNPLNARKLLEQEHIKRGEILAANGTVLARSLPGREGTYTRTYPTGSLFAHPIGYYYTQLGDSGLERFRNDELEGQGSTNLQSILNQLQGVKPDGDEGPHDARPDRPAGRRQGPRRPPRRSRRARSRAAGP